MTTALAAILAATLVSGKGGERPSGYVPPLVANGELSMTVDRDFAVRSVPSGAYSQGIFLAGRRVSHPRRELLPQGCWRKVLEVNGREPECLEWEQTLDVSNGTLTCRLRCRDLDFIGETFIPLSENTVAIRETVVSRSAQPLDVRFGVRFEPVPHERIVGSVSSDGLVWRYRSYGYRILDGETSLSAADESFALAPGARRTIERFIVFSDSLRRNASGPRDFAALAAANVRAWTVFRGESAVELPEPALQRMWEMANYHLRINATPWSFPVGLLDSHWQGLYFGFDAMYMHQGLVASGHFATSRREPDYRFATLQKAIDRTAYGKRCRDYGARWHWEGLEDGLSEGTVPGVWQDHIFHMAAIAKCAWQQWLYGRDRAWFAEKGYPVLFEAARYFRRNWVYEDSNGDTYIGKCCDLERLGPARDRPFMTTVGAVYAMRAAAEASDLLGTNAVAAADFRACADGLVRSLPVRDGRYIACLNDPQESMATLAGFFPFPVFPPDHAPQREAVRHFIEKGRASGNMYPTGRNVCPWYAGTMSAAASWMGDRTEPVRWLREAAGAAGLFGEFFEINEPGVMHHPWFATAAGNCLFAVDQMLLCDCEGKIRLAFTVPEAWRDYAFRLPSQRGVTVDAAVRNGRLAKFAVTRRADGDGDVLVFTMRPAILEGIDPARFSLRPLSRAADRVDLAYDDGLPAVELPGEAMTNAPISCAPFPDRMSAYVWRNWFVVPHDRLARVVGATEADLARVDSRIGYESSCQYFFVPQDLREKILSCRLPGRAVPFAR